MVVTATLQSVVVLLAVVVGLIWCIADQKKHALGLIVCITLVIGALLLIASGHIIITIH